MCIPEETRTMSERTAPKIGLAWGDNISKKRQRELDRYLDALDAEGDDHGTRRGVLRIACCE